MTIGEQVRNARESKHMTIARLEELTGVTVHTIGRFERGIISSRIDTIELVLDALGYHLEVVPNGIEPDCQWK